MHKLKIFLLFFLLLIVPIACDCISNITYLAKGNDYVNYHLLVLLLDTFLLVIVYVFF